MSLLTMQTCAKLDIHICVHVYIYIKCLLYLCICSTDIDIKIVLDPYGYIYMIYMYIYNPVQICHQDPGDAFDFLDVRSCGTISLREVGVKWMVQLMFCAVCFLDA